MNVKLVLENCQDKFSSTFLFQYWVRILSFTHIQAEQSSNSWNIEGDPSTIINCNLDNLHKTYSNYCLLQPAHPTLKVEW